MGEGVVGAVGAKNEEEGGKDEKEGSADEDKPTERVGGEVCGEQKDIVGEDGEERGRESKALGPIADATKPKEEGKGLR